MRAVKIAAIIPLIVLCLMSRVLADGEKNLAAPNGDGPAKDQFAGEQKKDKCAQKRDALKANLDARASEIKGKWNQNNPLGLPIESTHEFGNGDKLTKRYKEVQRLKQELAKVNCSDLDKWAKDHGMGDDDLEAAKGQEEYQRLIDSGMSRQQALQTMQQGADMGIMLAQDSESKLKALQNAKAKFNSVDSATAGIYDQKIADLKDQVAFGREMAQNDAKLADALKGRKGAAQSDSGVAGNWIGFAGPKPGDSTSPAPGRPKSDEAVAGNSIGFPSDKPILSGESSTSQPKVPGLFSTARSEDGSRIDPKFVPKQDGDQITFPSPSRNAIGSEPPIPEIALVPGLQTSSQDQARYGEVTAKATGADTTLFHNKMQEALSDVRTAGNDSGRSLDPSETRLKGQYGNDTTKPLANWIYGKVTSGKDAPIICHSEGEIITGNAITEVKKRLIADGYTPEESIKALGRIKVASFGGASDDSGQFQGIGVWHRVVHEKDPIANYLGAGNNKFAADIDAHSFPNTYVPSFSSDMFSKSGTFILHNHR